MEIDAAQVDRARGIFRQAVWRTTLGVRAKLTLIALADIGTVEGMSISAPSDTFQRMTSMMGRHLSSVVCGVERLCHQSILEITPSPTGYLIHFRPENEIQYGPRGGGRKMAQR